MRSAFLVPAEVETERLRLRLPVADDVADFAAMLADPEVHRFIGGDALQTRAGAFRALGWLIGHWHLRGYGPWIVVDKASGTLIGHIGPYYPPDWPGLEIIWTLGRSWWGQGLAAEGAAAARAVVVHHLQPSRLVSIVANGNERSAQLAIRLGCVAEEATTIQGTPCIVFAHPMGEATCEGEGEPS